MKSIRIGDHLTLTIIGYRNDHTIGSWCTPIDLNLLNFDLFLLLSRGVNVVHVKITSYLCASISREII